MRIVILLIILSFLQTVAHGQTRTIRGIVYDKQTNAHIQGVKITPDFYGNDTTNETGRFKVFLLKKYKDTVNFTHEDYYPFTSKINDSKPRFIYLTPRNILLDTIFYPVFDEISTLNGKVFETKTRKYLNNICFQLEDKKIVGYSDKRGEFEIALPKSTRKLLVSGKDYITDTLNIYKKDFSKEQHVFLVPVDFSGDLSKENNYYSNIALLAVNELLSKSIGIRYLRFINIKHAIGLHASYYLLTQRNVPYNGPNKYTSLKLSALYRYYFMRNMSNQSFVEGKLIGGYFDFKSLAYSRSGLGEDFIYIPVTFNSFGFGVNWGYEKISRNKHLVFGLSVGLQYFPMHVETIYIDEHDVTWETDTWWWYGYGPGSLLEIKIYLGGIF